MDMKGLSSFISEVRKAGSDQDKVNKRVEKELAKIRKKFKNAAKLKGYDRKKYICKMLYIYMLGYDLNTGHIEAVNLISSNKYSEKHVGYLACSLLLNEDHELVTLITQSLKRDIESNIPDYQCLALSTVANIGGREQAEELALTVQKVLVKNTTTMEVKKKAALTLLRLFRKYPEIISPEDWSDRIVNLMNIGDLGVCTSVMSLILGLVASDPQGYANSVENAISILVKLVINKSYPRQYLYYGLPAPWLQIKLLRLLQYYPMPEDSGLKKNIHQVIGRLIYSVMKIKKGEKMSRLNALHSVLFECLNVLIHYDSDNKMLKDGVKLLGKYLDDKDANLRYLSLDTFARMVYSTHEDVVQGICTKQNTILVALKDPDISIRRRALDLLYSMCNNTNASEIVGELLEYLPLSDFEIREELVLKIAILAENFAADLTWYVDVMINLITTSGDFVSKEIWYRVAQVITNSDDDTLRKYAAKTIYLNILETSAHERIVKLAGYILGEYGVLLHDDNVVTFMDQFKVLLTKFELVNDETKSLLLNCFMKIYNLDDENSVRGRIKNLFKRLMDNVDQELQQRAVEYYNLCESGQDITQIVLDIIPKFPETDENILIAKIRSKQKGATESNIRQQKHFGEKDSTTTNEEDSTDTNDIHLSKQTDDAEPSNNDNNLLDMGENTTNNNNTLLGDLDDILNVPGLADAQPTAPPQHTQQANELDIFDFGGSSSQNNPPPQVEQDESGEIVNEQAEKEAEALYENLRISNSGVAIEDDLIQIYVESQFKDFRGRMKLSFGNKSNGSIEEVRSTMDFPRELEVTKTATSPIITQDAQISQYVNIICKHPFTDPLKFSLYFTYKHKHYRFNIRLPVELHKFMTPKHFDGSTQFFNVWNEFGKKDEHMDVIKAEGDILDIKKCEEILRGHNLSNLSSFDKNPNNLVGSGEMHFSEVETKHFVFVRLQTNPQAKAYRLTTRGDHPTTTKHFHESIKKHLN
mmetsp:Transcript_14257/g.21550  ORF Transcript_14257/g.21550 Transcript_14257/m.21550 type:complete len:985 (-) Transcript_14257:40-2994(-)